MSYIVGEWVDPLVVGWKGCLWIGWSFSWWVWVCWWDCLAYQLMGTAPGKTVFPGPLTLHVIFFSGIVGGCSI